MFKINKLRANPVIDFAGEELRKYLWMMMPEGGGISLSYAPEAKDGFRLGLLGDFGLPCEASDPVLDDVIHIDTTTTGGILAGSNPRSVLFAVYRFLRENGCRWLYPGVDGEHIPVRDIQKTYYHKLADHRFRGHCNEGAESQTCMLETIDFYAKLELNVYMIEFDTPFVYYNNYYNHVHNRVNRPAEPVSLQQVKQWKRQCEAEISKRGLQFHDMGHGWTAEPFGISSTQGWKAVEDQSFLSEEQRESLAMVNGVRELYGGVALNTNLCMSNPRVRKKMVDYIAQYAQEHPNVDYLHIWLADNSRNHCECDECIKMRPSDYYMMLMNELDDDLTGRNLDTRIVFIAYVDTSFGPEKVFIQNPNRFSLLYAPITRLYTESFQENTVLPEPIPYVRNKWKYPKTTGENIALLKTWLKNWHGPSFSYEYHFWRHQHLDPGLLYLSRRIYEDIRALKWIGLDGFVEDGSQRSFFPNGFHMYIYAEALMNRDCDFDAVLADYFSHIYGPDWQQVRDLMQRISDVFDFAYMSGLRSADNSKSIFYAPEKARELEMVKDLAEEEYALAMDHLAMPTRPQTVSWRLLLRHSEYCRKLAACIIEKAQGNDEEALALWEAFRNSFGQYEFELERYFDHCQAFKVIKRIVNCHEKSLVMGE